MDSNEVILENAAWVFIVKLKDTDSPKISYFLFISDSTAYQVINSFELQKVVDLFIEGILSGEDVANECLLC